MITDQNVRVACGGRTLRPSIVVALNGARVTDLAHAHDDTPSKCNIQPSSLAGAVSSSSALSHATFLTSGRLLLSLPGFSTFVLFMAHSPSEITRFSRAWA